MTGASGNARTLRSDIVFAFTLALACMLAWLVRDVLVLLYVSALIAVVVGPLVRSTSRLAVGRWHPFKGSALFFLLLAAAAGITSFGFLALPPVLRDLQALGAEMPKRLPAILDKFHHIPFADQLNTDDISSKVQDFASQGVAYLLLSIRDWAGKLFNVIMGLVLTVYFILEGDHAYRWFLSFFSHASRDRLDATLQRAEVRMGRWLLGQGSLMLILGVTSTLVYLFLHVRYAYALGLLTGLLNIIPVLGAALCILLAMLVAALDSWGRVVGVAAFYLIYLNVENAYLIPRIMQRSVNLPGLAILIALVLGSALEGVVGALVSVPTAVLVAVLLDEYLVNKKTA
jgi:predicted PurR-regulated permease PerM